MASEPIAPRKSWAWRISVIGLVGALGAVAIAVGAVTLARYDVIDKLGGFITFMGMLPVVGVAGAIGLLGVLFGFFGKRGLQWPGLLAIVLALGLAGTMYFQVMVPAQSAPPLHDITTDVDTPPQFVTLPLREDNLIPFNSIEDWRAAHREGYPALAPIVVNDTPAAVLAEAKVLAEARGWEIAAYDPATGHMEATATAGYIRFYDDVIVEVTPIADGSTRVDMRSVSRVGLSDLGYNAARIEAFLAELAGA